MDILSSKPFFVYILNMKIKPVRSLKFMMFAYASRAPACVMHSRDEKPYMLKNEGYFAMELDDKSIDPILNVACYKPQEHCDGQVDRQKWINN